MSTDRARPLVIAVTACLKGEGIARYQHTGAKYVDALCSTLPAMPVILPSRAAGLDHTALLAMIDGILLTGSPSNIEPRHYHGGETLADDQSDPARDATTLSLIPAAIEAGVPVLGLCRGHQEINVALGGTINPKVHETEGRFDHRSDKTKPHEDRYAPCHKVHLSENGRLRAMIGEVAIEVNSLHGQAVDRPGRGLMVEAVADDGTIEAISLQSDASFCVGVQWHPEWQPCSYAPYRLLFEGFGAACHTRAARRDHACNRGSKG